MSALSQPMTTWTPPEEERRLERNRAYQKKQRDKKKATQPEKPRKRSLEELAKLDRAATGDPEAQARYERFPATRRETTTGRNKRKPKPSKPSNAGTENARDNEVRGVFIVTAVPANPYTSAVLPLEFPAQT